MKTKQLINLITLLICIVSFGQKIETIEGFRDNTIQKYFDDISVNESEKSKRFVNDKVLNIFFADEISSYISESKDLSLQKAYAVISTADKTLFLGTSFELCREDKTDKLTNLVTIGVKAKLKDDFSTIFKNGDIQNDIGINAKYTWIGRGILNFGNHTGAIKTYREKILKGQFQSEIKDYLSKSKDSSARVKLAALYGKDPKTYKKKEAKLYSNKASEIYTKFAETEVKLIKDEKLYRWFWNHYAVFEVYAPVTKKSYTLLPDVNTSTTSTEKVYPWKFLAGYTNFLKKSNGQVVYLSGIASVFNNNNAAIESLDQFDLQTPNDTNPNLIEDTTKVFIGGLDEFVTTNVKVEAVSYLVNNGMFGISASIEQNFGDYDALNWKLGIPVSLKDKEGKPNVNFELQWKEINGNHFVGIGVGLAFGKFIN